MPKDFADTEINNNVNDITLRVGDVDTNIVTMIYNKLGRSQFGRVQSGWKGFVQEHGLEYGDAIRIEVDSRDRSVWNVTIFKEED